jgi:hypothetical protein
MGPWRVTVKPAGENPNQETGLNDSGVGIFLEHEDRDQDLHEVSRVAFIRRNSANPRVGLEEQYEAELKTARWAADRMNRHEADLMRTLEFAGSDRLA